MVAIGEGQTEHQRLGLGARALRRQDDDLDGRVRCAGGDGGPRLRIVRLDQQQDRELRFGIVEGRKGREQGGHHRSLAVEGAEDRVAGEVCVGERMARQGPWMDRRGQQPNDRPQHHEHADRCPGGQREGRRRKGEGRAQARETQPEPSRGPPHQAPVSGGGLRIASREAGHRLLDPDRFCPAAQQRREGGGRRQHQRQGSARNGDPPRREPLGRRAIGGDEHRHAADRPVDGHPAALAQGAPIGRVRRDAERRLGRMTPHRCGGQGGRSSPRV